MRTRYSIGFLGIALIMAGCSTESAPNVGKGQHMIGGHQVYVVVLKGGSPGGVAASVGAQPTHVFEHALNGFAAALPPQAVAALQRNPNVQFIQADQPVKAIAQSVPTGVDRMEVEKNLTLTGDAATGATVDVDVAVIDTGVYAHPDLNVVQKTLCAQKGPYNRKCTDGAGEDGDGHGTHVAGSIGALDNGLGVVGVAPGARIWAVKVLDDSGSGWTSWIVAGIDWVAAHASEIEVANMSLGGSGSDDGNCGLTNGDAKHYAICGAVSKGVVFVVAAGNEADDAAKHTPAAYDEVITVSALADLDGLPGGLIGPGFVNCRNEPEADDSLAWFSNFGADVDIMAPGYCITSTWNDGGYNTISGTSMASPHVAGLAALYVAKNGAPTNAAGVAAVRQALVDSAIPQNDPSCGLATDDDDDGFAEPIAFANAIALGGDGTCGPSSCTSDLDCDDGAFCNGAETCDLASGSCLPGTAPDCSGTGACTAYSCSETIDACVSEPIAGCCTADADCIPPNSCTTATCDGNQCVFTTTAEICGDSSDNDCDGLIDDADPDCKPACIPTGTTETNCGDKIDNDCDGLLDTADPDCATCKPQYSKCKSDGQCCNGTCVKANSGDRFGVCN